MDIQHCKVEFRCPKTWDALTLTADLSVRYCAVCDRGVHYCKTKEELLHANQQGWCVAVKIRPSASNSDKTMYAYPKTDPRRMRELIDDIHTVGIIKVKYEVDDEAAGGK